MKHLTQEEWAVMIAQEAEPGFVGWLPPTEARGFRLQMQIPPTRIGGPGWYERDAEPLYAASALAARDQRIAELERREQQAWLAAWDAEYRAQEWQRSFVAFAGAARVLHDPLEQRIAAQDALLRRGEAALEVALGAESDLTADEYDGAAATLAAIREQREEQRRRRIRACWTAPPDDDAMAAVEFDGDRVVELIERRSR